LKKSQKKLLEHVFEFQQWIKQQQIFCYKIIDIDDGIVLIYNISI
jgi:hypothetical protein